MRSHRTQAAELYYLQTPFYCACICPAMRFCLLWNARDLASSLFSQDPTGKQRTWWVSLSHLVKLWKEGHPVLARIPLFSNIAMDKMQSAGLIPFTCDQYKVMHTTLHTYLVTQRLTTFWPQDRFFLLYKERSEEWSTPIRKSYMVKLNQKIFHTLFNKLK